MDAYLALAPPIMELPPSLCGTSVPPLVDLIRWQINPKFPPLGL